MPARFVDLFCGAGGFSRGLLDSGWDLVTGVEQDKDAAATFATNYGVARSWRGDVRDFDAEALEEIDLLVAGLPSGGYSSLKGRPSGQSGDLWREFARIAMELRPRAFVLETVPAFMRSRDSRAWASLLEIGGPFDGYSVMTCQLDAVDFGVPQHRQRIYVIGLLGKLAIAPRPTHADANPAGLPAWRTLRDAIGDVPWETDGIDLPVRWTEVGGVRSRGPFSSTELHLGRRVKAESIVRADSVPPGGNFRDVPRGLLNRAWAVRPVGSRDSMGRLEWGKPSVALRREFYKPEKGRYLHPQWDPLDPNKRVNRSISLWEGARIQTFPDAYEWCGSKRQIGAQIGQATPVVLAAALGHHVRALLEGESTPDLEAAQHPLFR